MSAVCLTSVGTATEIVSGVYVLDRGTTEDEMIGFLIEVLRRRVADAGHEIIGDVDVKRFEVEYL
jgi:hypothetical protein